MKYIAVTILSLLISSNAFAQSAHFGLPGDVPVPAQWGLPGDIPQWGQPGDIPVTPIAVDKADITIQIRMYDGEPTGVVVGPGGEEFSVDLRDVLAKGALSKLTKTMELVEPRLNGPVDGIANQNPQN